MIVLFTANNQGGVLQFTLHLTNVINDIGYEAVCYIPKDSLLDEYYSGVRWIKYYTKFKTINYKDRKIKALANNIMELNPKMIWYCDESPLCSEMGLFLNKKVRQIMTFHDAGIEHPTNKISIKSRLRRMFEIWIGYKCADRIDDIMLLSEESKRIYLNIFPSHISKIRMLLLGAHIPNVDPMMPAELQEEKDDGYYLFFGRIDKYKGLYNLLSAYSDINCNRKLIIAGNGKLTNNEAFLCENPNIILLNRYIYDNEMKWLFEHCSVVCLPYIEATQSGVIPIAYKYGKPVITSNVFGLTQFVIDKETGFITSNESELKSALMNSSNDNLVKSMGIAAKAYYEAYLDWEANLNKLFSELKIE